MRYPKVNSLPLIEICVSDFAVIELEEMTFDIMWDMSKPESDAQECFLRQPQTQYYHDAKSDVHMFEKMPDVSSTPTLRFIS